MESILLAKEGGQAAVLVPGGAPEALNCDKGEVGGGSALGVEYTCKKYFPNCKMYSSKL